MSTRSRGFQSNRCYCTLVGVVIEEQDSIQLYGSYLVPWYSSIFLAFKQFITARALNRTHLRANMEITLILFFFTEVHDFSLVGFDEAVFAYSLGQKASSYRGTYRVPLFY